jgi:hypothetical protein
MANDTINPGDQPQALVEEKVSQEHIEALTDSPETGTPPAEWEDEKPKLNLQMALAFIVRQQLSWTYCLNASKTIVDFPRL